MVESLSSTVVPNLVFIIYIFFRLCGVIDSTFLSDINMVDFAVSNVGEIWILNWSSTLVRV
jgi:hypothetical protein